MARTKVFRSGNSMAVRLPAVFGAVEGTPVEVREEQGRWIVEALPNQPGKIDLTGIYGSCPDMEPITDRWFEDRPSERIERERLTRSALGD